MNFSGLKLPEVNSRVCFGTGEAVSIRKCTGYALVDVITRVSLVSR